MRVRNEETDMRILLIRPRPHRETIGLQSVMICEPLELMTLAAVLKKNGHRVEIADMIIDRRPLGKLVADFAPHIVGLTGYISHVNIIKEYASQIKAVDSDIRVMVGGVHAEVCPEDFIDDNIDMVCKSAVQFYDAAGCSDRENVLPFRDLPKAYRRRYYYLFQQNCALIKTSFGCPYSCNFCFCKEISPYKVRDMDDVIAELMTIRQQEIYIVDDDFLFNRDRLMEFVGRLRENNIHKHYLVYGRADFIAANEDIISELKSVGLSAVIVGLESPSQKELDSYNKKTKVDDNRKAVGILKKLGIECYATVILGSDWDMEDFNNLYRFLKSLDIVFVNLQPFTPMPHTPYFEECRDNLIIPYGESEKWDMAHLVVRPAKLSLRQYYWQIIRLYYKITVTPSHSWYMIRRYGLGVTMKLSLGALRITGQYIRKMLGR